MKWVIVLVIMLSIVIFVYADFEMLTTIPHGALVNPGWFSIGKFDFNNNGIEELILHTAHFKIGDIYPYHPFFEYRREGGYHFEEVYRIVFPHPASLEDTTFTAPIGIGDFDNDGLYEMVEIMRVVNKNINIHILEQKSREEFPDTTKQVLWLADTTYSFGPLDITNELKGDSIDRLVWVGLPGITTRTRSYGWGYLEYVDENTLELTHTFAETVQLKEPVIVGNLNNNGLVDVIIATNFYASSKILWYEATDKTGDSFNFKDSIRFSVWNYNDPLLRKMIITNDINGNGYNEILLANSWYMDGLTLYQYYRYYLVEYNPEKDILEIKWTTECSSPPNPNITVWANADLLSSGAGCDCGDIDGDGLEDILINGGRHVEIWKNYGGDIYGKIYEWTDSTYQTLCSTVRAYDFNGNGMKEVLFSGHDYWCPPPYPTEYTPEEYQRTYVFEYRRLQVDVDNVELARDVDTLIFGSSVNGDTLYKEIKFCNVGYDTIKLDSIVFESECYGVKGSFPELIWVGERVGKEIWFKGDSSGRYLDSAWIYGDSNRYKLMLKGAYRYKVEIDSIAAKYVSIYDRNIVSVYFNEKTTMPEITEDNIDEVLRLSGGHSWRDKFGEIYGAKWLRYNGKDKLVVQLSAGGNRPTVSVGDSVYVDNGVIKDEWLNERVVTTGVIRGELYFSGIDGEEIDRDGLSLRYRGGVLCYSVKEGERFEIEVYDVMGRVIAKRDESKGREGIIDMNVYGNGVYFVRMRKGEEIINRKIIKMR